MFFFAFSFQYFDYDASRHGFLWVNPIWGLPTLNLKVCVSHIVGNFKSFLQVFFFPAPHFLSSPTGIPMT